MSASGPSGGQSSALGWSWETLSGPPAVWKGPPIPPVSELARCGRPAMGLHYPPTIAFPPNLERLSPCPTTPSTAACSWAAAPPPSATSSRPTPCPRPARPTPRPRSSASPASASAARAAGDIDQAGKLMRGRRPVRHATRNTPRQGGRAAKGAKTFTDYRKLFDESAKKSTPSPSARRTTTTPWPSVTGHAGRQARLLPEAADAHGVRGAAACGRRPRRQASAPRWATRGRPRTGCGGRSSWSRPAILGDRQGGPRLDQPADLAAGPGRDEAAGRRRPGPGGAGLGAFIGPATRLRPVQQKARRTTRSTGAAGWDFGTGAIGDMACHTANMAFRALKLDQPDAVAAEAGDVNAETYPASARRSSTLPGPRRQPPGCTLHWYEGKKDGKKVLPPRGAAREGA